MNESTGITSNESLTAETRYSKNSALHDKTAYIIQTVPVSIPHTQKHDY